MEGRGAVWHLFDDVFVDQFTDKLVEGFVTNFVSVMNAEIARTYLAEHRVRLGLATFDER